MQPPGCASMVGGGAPMERRLRNLDRVEGSREANSRGLRDVVARAAHEPALLLGIAHAEIQLEVLEELPVAIGERRVRIGTLDAGRIDAIGEQIADRRQRAGDTEDVEQRLNPGDERATGRQWIDRAVAVDVDAVEVVDAIMAVVATEQIMNVVAEEARQP